MKTDNGRSHEVRRSGRQCAGGNPRCGGPAPQARGPKEDELTTSSLTEGRPSLCLGKPFVANGAGVGEVGTRVLGLHSDPGRPYVLPTAKMRESPGLGPRWRIARETGEVDPTAMSGRRDEGVGWRHSTEEVS